MTNGGMIDLDQHASDLTIDDWEQALPKDLREHAPRNAVVDGVERLVIENRAFPRPKGPGVGSPKGSGAGGAQVSIADRTEWMDENDIDWAVLTPGNLGMALHAVEDIRLRKAIGHHYREWQLAQVDKAADRFLAALLVDPFSLPSKEQLENGRVGALFMRPTSAHALHMWDSPVREVLTLASDTGLPLMLHGGTGYYQHSPVANCYENYFYTHLFSHVVEMQIALAELVGGALLQEYDNLKVIFVEAGVAWVPSFVSRLKGHVHRLPQLVSQPAEDVDHLLAHRCLFSVFSDDAEGLGRLLRENEWMRAAVGSDYPHWDTLDLGTTLRDVPPEDQEAIARGNASRVLARHP